MEDTRGSMYWRQRSTLALWGVTWSRHTAESQCWGDKLHTDTCTSPQAVLMHPTPLPRISHYTCTCQYLASPPTRANPEHDVSWRGRRCGHRSPALTACSVEHHKSVSLSLQLIPIQSERKYRRHSPVTGAGVCVALFCDTASRVYRNNMLGFVCNTVFRLPHAQLHYASLPRAHLYCYFKEKHTHTHTHVLIKFPPRRPHAGTVGKLNSTVSCCFCLGAGGGWGGEGDKNRVLHYTMDLRWVSTRSCVLSELCLVCWHRLLLR